MVTNPIRMTGAPDARAAQEMRAAVYGGVPAEDAAERRVEAPEPQEREREEPTGRAAEQRTTISTDKVDEEITALKEKRDMLAMSLRGMSEEDGRQTQQELQRIEDELRQKDNEEYRRQNAEIRQGVDVMA
ncbi:MAG: hypothetical protein IJU05_06680 [Schwartzia sp.]|nr:hypothetical protein [Schwartzia sp. (in: firmicutes)]